MEIETEDTWRAQAVPEGISWEEYLTAVNCLKKMPQHMRNKIHWAEIMRTIKQVLSTGGKIASAASLFIPHPGVRAGLAFGGEFAQQASSLM
jgi:hypothetical protein